MANSDSRSELKDLLPLDQHSRVSTCRGERCCSLPKQAIISGFIVRNGISYSRVTKCYRKPASIKLSNPMSKN